MKSQPKSNAHAKRMEQGTSFIEWIAAAVGGILFIAMIGYMTYVGLNETEGNALIKISSLPSVQQSATFLVRFEAENIGTQTASGLVVRATLSQDEKEIETSEVTIDYLPAGSVRSGGFFFKHDPSAYELELAPVSYLDP